MAPRTVTIACALVFALCAATFSPVLAQTKEGVSKPAEKSAEKPTVKEGAKKDVSLSSATSELAAARSLLLKGKHEEAAEAYSALLEAQPVAAAIGLAR
ncbi:MAG TPA: hypothetical protein VGJ26_19280, partial [Pirellulales bacterium]